MKGGEMRNGRKHKGSQDAIEIKGVKRRVRQIRRKIENNSEVVDRDNRTIGRKGRLGEKWGAK